MRSKRNYNQSPDRYSYRFMDNTGEWTKWKEQSKDTLLILPESQKIWLWFKSKDGWIEITSPPGIGLIRELAFHGILLAFENHPHTPPYTESIQNNQSNRV